MTITDAQFKLLAQEYMFDINEAKSFLGISQTKKSQSTKELKFPTIPSHIPYVKNSNFGKLSDSMSVKSVKSVRSVKSVNETRTPTGYHLFLSRKKDAVKAELQKRGEIPSHGVVIEVAKQWKQLSKEKRDAWNAKAKNTHS